MENSISINIITILSLLIFLSLPTPSLSQRCNKNDQKILFQIKKSFGNAYHFASWQKKTDCCDWYNVDCDPKTNRIIALTIFSTNISGQIPPQVGDLSYLKTLVLRKLPNLTGQISPAITKLAHLTMLQLSYNDLSGPVPSFLSQLKNLELLDLSFNRLTGSIPPELAKFTKLAVLHLDGNKLTGVIPGSFGTFTGSVPDLYLSRNQLTGEVPKSLGNLNFTVIKFSRNQLTGDLSMFFGTHKTIQIADFSMNNFQFNMSKVVFPASLRSLDVNHNKIYGSLPSTLAGLGILNVSYNSLCGKIPQGGNLQTLEATSFFHNRCLCGSPLPACKR